MSARLAAGALALALALSACSEDEAKTPSGEAPIEHTAPAPETVVDKWVQASVAGDGDAACEVVGEQFQGGLRPDPCGPAMLEWAAQTVEHTGADLSYTSRVKGGLATVVAGKDEGRRFRFTLDRVEGEWVIVGLETCSDLEVIINDHRTLTPDPACELTKGSVA